MADITVDASVNSTLYTRSIRAGPVWVGPDTAYAFYVDGSANFVYRKTTDGGATWGSPVTVIAAGTFLQVSIWYDRWTPGSVGRTIHCVVTDSSADDVIYRGLATVTDTLSTQIVVFDGATFTGAYPVDIVRARGGNLYIGFWGDTDGERGFYRSTDNGATWTSRAQVADGDAADGILLMPGNETDKDDIWCIYWDRSADELSLKVYDNSGDSGSETTVVSATDSSTYYQMSVAPRHSDNHVLLAVWNKLPAASADLLLLDIGDSSDITGVGIPLLNTDESAQVAILINQQNDDIYVAYLKGGTWEATVDVKYKKSTDGGTTWGSEQDYSQASADDIRAVWAGISIGSDGGRFQPTWFNDDLDDLFVNVANSILVEAFVRPFRNAYVGASVDAIPSQGSARS